MFAAARSITLLMDRLCKHSASWNTFLAEVLSKSASFKIPWISFFSSALLMSAILINSDRSETPKNAQSDQIGENIGTRCGDAGLMLQLLPRPPQWTAAEGSSHTAARVGRTSLRQKLPSFGAKTPHFRGRMKRKQGFSAIMLIFRLMGATLG